LCVLSKSLCTRSKIISYLIDVANRRIGAGNSTRQCTESLTLRRWQNSTNSGTAAPYCRRSRRAAHTAYSSTKRSRFSGSTAFDSRTRSTFRSTTYCSRCAKTTDISYSLSSARLHKLCDASQNSRPAAGQFSGSAR